MFDELKMRRILNKISAADHSDDYISGMTYEFDRLITKSKISNERKKVLLKKAIENNAYQSLFLPSGILYGDDGQTFEYDIFEILKNDNIALEYNKKNNDEIVEEIEKLENRASNSKILLIVSNLNDEKLKELINRKPEYIFYYYSDNVDMILYYIISNNISININDLDSNINSQSIIIKNMNKYFFSNKAFIEKLIREDPNIISKFSQTDDELEEIFYQILIDNNSYIYSYNGNYPKTIELIKETIRKNPIDELKKMTYVNQAVIDVSNELLEKDPTLIFEIPIINTLSSDKSFFDKIVTLLTQKNVKLEYEKISKWLSFYDNELPYASVELFNKMLNDDKRNIEFFNIMDGKHDYNTLFEILNNDFSLIQYLTVEMVKEIRFWSDESQNNYGNLINCIKTNIDNNPENIKYVIHLLDFKEIYNIFYEVLDKDFTIMRYFSEYSKNNASTFEKLYKKMDDIMIEKIKESPSNGQYYYGNNIEVYKLIVENGQTLSLNQLSHIIFTKEMLEDKNNYFVNNLIEQIKKYNPSLNKDKLLNLLTYLIINNDDILKTINYEIFKSEYINILMDKGDFQYDALRIIFRYKDIQENIIKCYNKVNDKNLLHQIINYNLSKDLDSIYMINDILINLQDNININSYNIAVNALENNPDKSEKILQNITYILSKKGLKYQIENENDIINYEEKLDNYCNQIVDNLEGIENLIILKDSILLKKFGITYKEAVYIQNDYAGSLDISNDELTSEEIKLVNILKAIKSIVYCCDKYKLGVCYHEMDNNTELKLNETYKLESKIRKMYARHLNNSLLSIDKMKDTKLDDKYGLKIYEAFDQNNPEEFKILLTCLGAYFNYEKPDNYKDDWLRPSELSHGFCVSLISNQMMGTAPMNYACLGFTNIPNENLLLSAPNDIGSDTLSMDIVNKHKGRINFLFPDDMIDRTRHTYNELVIERLVEGGKIYPSYVIYMTENFDKNNLDNLADIEKQRWDNALQAARDMGLPIVVVDRGKIMAYENKKREELMKNFKSGNNNCENSLYDLLIRTQNNRTGCRKCWNSKGLDDKDIVKLFNEIESSINNMISEGKLESATKCCDAIIKWLEFETAEENPYVAMEIAGGIQSKERPNLGISEKNISIMVKELLKNIEQKKKEINKNMPNILEGNTITNIQIENDDMKGRSR